MNEIVLRQWCKCCGRPVMCDHKKCLRCILWFNGRLLYLQGLPGNSQEDEPIPNHYSAIVDKVHLPIGCRDDARRCSMKVH